MNATTSHLQPGMIVIYGHAQWRVVMVNQCRAVIVPLVKIVRVFQPATGLNAGRTLVLAVKGRPVSISPNSDLPIVGSIPLPSMPVRHEHQRKGKHGAKNKLTVKSKNTFPGPAILPGRQDLKKVG